MIFHTLCDLYKSSDIIKKYNIFPCYFAHLIKYLLTSNNLKECMVTKKKKGPVGVCLGKDWMENWEGIGHEEISNNGVSFQLMIQLKENF